MPRILGHQNRPPDPAKTLPVNIDFFTPAMGNGNAANNKWDRVMFGIDDVMAIDVNFSGSGALDNIVFNYTPVPAPGTLALLGLALIGLGLRRRRTA